MNLPAPSHSEIGLAIAAVERETGLSKDTLRVWEKRYGFPNPHRDAFDDRRYNPAQVQRLKLIKRLIDSGYRPGKIVGMNEVALQELLDNNQHLSKTTTSAAADKPNISLLLDALSTHDLHTLRNALNHAQMRLGLKAFVLDVVAPLTTAVGDAWERGKIEVFEEHFFTEVVTSLLRTYTTSFLTQAPTQAPKVLLTTLPPEQHGLGLLMVEALLALEGCPCVQLGTQTPINDVVLAAKAHNVDVVALSFTNLHSNKAVLASLTSMREALPPEVSLWAGGSCKALYQKPLVGIETSPELTSLEGLVMHWRRDRNERSMPIR